MLIKIMITVEEVLISNLLTKNDLNKELSMYIYGE